LYFSCACSLSLVLASEDASLPLLNACVPILLASSSSRQCPLLHRPICDPNLGTLPYLKKRVPALEFRALAPNYAVI
jgi:hypothetical protein